MLIYSHILAAPANNKFLIIFHSLTSSQYMERIASLEKNFVQHSVSFAADMGDEPSLWAMLLANMF